MNQIKKKWFKAVIIAAVLLLSAACNKPVVKNESTQQTQKHDTAQNLTATPTVESAFTATTTENTKNPAAVNEKGNDITKKAVDNSAALLQAQQEADNARISQEQAEEKTAQQKAAQDTLDAAAKQAQANAEAKSAADAAAQSAKQQASLAAQQAQQQADQQAAQAAAQAQQEAAARQALIQQIQTECTDPINKLTQQILQLKADYYVKVQQIQTHGTESGTPAVFWQADINKLTSDTNNQINQLNNQAQQIKVSCSIKFPSTIPTALCNDGNYSYSAHDSGTCSDHGGVSVWYK